MLRLRIPISGSAAAAATDRLLAVAPHGLHELDDALVLHAEELPDPERIRAALGIEEFEITPVSDDAAERLGEIARPAPVDGRLLVRASWMDPLPGVEEVVLADATAFGTGAHPTTRDCLSMLLALEPGGSFADLGCGAGVLAIAAAKLGWDPVLAVDVATRAVEATRANATANGVKLEASEADLLTSAPPPADTVAANVPVEVHAAIAAAWDEPPEVLIVSGVHGDDRPAILAAYGGCGLGLVEERAADPWLTLLLRRGAPAREAGAAGPAAEPAAAPLDEPPPPDGSRLIELGARAALFELAPGVRFDLWALDDSMRWALRGPPGTTMFVEEESRLVPADGDGGAERPPSTVRLRLRVDTPKERRRATLYVTVASAGAGLVRVEGSAAIEAA